MRPESIKLLKENIGNMLSETDLSNSFTLDLSLRQGQQVSKWDSQQTKSLVQLKKPSTKQKGKLPELYSLLATDTPDKGLISKIYEELITAKKKNPL